MRKGLLILLMITAASCASSGPDGGADGEGRMPPMRRMRSAETADLLPPPRWWHSPYMSEPVHLTGEQMQALDLLQKDLGDEIVRLERDVEVLTRDLRAAVAASDASEERISDAGARLAGLRDQLFRRQIEMLARERAVLSHEQWTALMRTLEEERRPRMERGGPRGGMGGRGGGGRRPPGGGAPG